MADWTRSSLETKVMVLAAQLEGKAFVDAIAELAATLDDEQRATLREILLQRARADSRVDLHAQLVRRRTAEPRWKRFLWRQRRGPGPR
jgi:uncharacterized tellurite resistance protein B-like protein